MAIVQNAVFDRLSTFAGLTAVVSTRSYPQRPPQDPTLPFVWFRVISATRPHAFGSDPGDVMSMVEVNAVDLTAEGAQTAGEQVRAAMSRWSGTHLGVVIQDSLIEQQREFFDENVEQYRELNEFAVWSKE